jgi:hypothetical protein
MEQENKYKEGSFVYDLKNPAVKMTIRRYLDRIYYCQSETHPEKPDMVFFERESTDLPPKV